MGKMTLILGGARSGKSAMAVEVGKNFGKVVYFATVQAQAEDEELAERIVRHKAERPAQWMTLEPPAGIEELLNFVTSSIPDLVIIDCATLWLAWELSRNFKQYTRTQLVKHLEHESKYFVRTLMSFPCPVLVVSNEVGEGVVPSSESGRVFRDALGQLNCMLAEASSIVLKTTAGISICVKDASEMHPGAPFSLSAVDVKWCVRKLK